MNSQCVNPVSDFEVQFPGVEGVVFDRGVKTETGSVVSPESATVNFCDGSSATVPIDSSTKNALLLAIVKRLYGKVDPVSGVVDDTANGVLDTLMVKAAYKKLRLLNIKPIPKLKRDSKGRVRDHNGRFTAVSRNRK